MRFPYGYGTQSDARLSAALTDATLGVSAGLSTLYSETDLRYAQAIADARTGNGPNYAKYAPTHWVFAQAIADAEKGVQTGIGVVYPPSSYVSAQLVAPFLGQATPMYPVSTSSGAGTASTANWIAAIIGLAQTAIATGTVSMGVPGTGYFVVATTAIGVGTVGLAATSASIILPAVTAFGVGIVPLVSGGTAILSVTSIGLGTVSTAVGKGAIASNVTTPTGIGVASTANWVGAIAIPVATSNAIGTVSTGSWAGGFMASTLSSTGSGTSSTPDWSGNYISGSTTSPGLGLNVSTPWGAIYIGPGFTSPCSGTASTATGVNVYDADVATYQTSILGVGGSISSAALGALDVFVKGLKSDGIWTQIIEIGPFCGNDLTSALVKLKTIGATSLASSNFVSGDYSQVTGLNPGTSNSTKKVATDLTPAAVTALGLHFAYYSRTNSSGPYGEIGAFDGTNYSGMFISYTGSGLSAAGEFDSYRQDTGGFVLTSNGAIPDSRGFFVGSRISATSFFLSRNGVSLATATTILGSKSTSAITVFNYSGAYTNRTCAYYSVGAALTTAQASAYYSRVQALQAALGRQV